MQSLGLLLSLQGSLGRCATCNCLTDGNLHEVMTTVLVYTEWRYLPQYSNSYATTLKQRLPQVSTSCSQHTLNTCTFTVYCLICALEYAITHQTGCV